MIISSSKQAFHHQLTFNKIDNNWLAHGMTPSPHCPIPLRCGPPSSPWKVHGVLDALKVHCNTEVCMKCPTWCMTRYSKAIL